MAPARPQAYQDDVLILSLHQNFASLWALVLSCAQESDVAADFKNNSG